MSEAKHTPGPWDNSDESKSESVTISGGRLRLVKADGVIVAFLPQWPGKKEEAQEAKANARLIAAAPDLLEALVAIDNALRTAWSTGSLPDSVIPAELAQQCRAAIAKATGKSQ